MKRMISLLFMAALLLSLTVAVFAAAPERDRASVTIQTEEDTVSPATFGRVRGTEVTAGRYLISGLSATALPDGTDSAFMTTEGVAAKDTRLKAAQFAIADGYVTTDNRAAMWDLIETEGGFYVRNVASELYLYWNSEKGGNKIYQTASVTEASVWSVIPTDKAGRDGYTLAQVDGRGISCNRFGSESNYYLGFAAYNVEGTSCACFLEFYGEGRTASTDIPEVDETVIASGTCGGDLTWVLTEDGVLTISGTGAMSNYNSDSNTAPWFSKRTKITSVVIEDGVTGIGYAAFNNCRNLTSVTIPEGVTSIDNSVFYNCSSLTSIILPDSVTSIGAYAFYDCSSLTSITIPEGVASIGNWAFDGCSDLWHVLYKGTEEDWNAISIGSSNWSLHSATRHYECVGDEVTDPVNKVCSICAAACQHQWQDATCTAPKTCALCNATEGVALGHNYETVVIAPTCEEAGYTLHTCASCGDSYGESYVEAIGHNYEYAEIAPTCTRQGYTLRICTNCSGSYIDNFTPAIGHDFGQWSVVLSPSCTEVGAEQRSCSRCNHNEVRETAATGHSYEARVIAATCTDMGFTIHTCHCGDGYVDTFTEITEHSYVDGVCEHCGVEEPFAILVGDVSGDGVVNYLDAMMIAQYYVGDIEATDLNVDAADVNGDGVVNYLDAMMVAQYYVGDIDSFPAEHK